MKIVRILHTIIEFESFSEIWERRLVFQAGMPRLDPPLLPGLGSSGAISTVQVMNHNDVHISVLAEEAPDTTDASELKRNFTAFQQKYNLPGSRMHFYFGAPEKEDWKGKQRFVRDLDMISLADVLVLSNGYFSSLGAALQMNGTAFSIRKSGNLADLPNHIANYSSSSDSGHENWPVPISGSAELAPFRLP